MKLLPIHLLQVSRGSPSSGNEAQELVQKPDCDHFRALQDDVFLDLRMRPLRVARATEPSNSTSTQSEVQRSLVPARGEQSHSDDVEGVWLSVADSGDGGKGAAAAADTPPAG